MEKNNIIARALALATEIYGEKTLTDGSRSYLMQPVETASILMQMDASEEVIASGILFHSLEEGGLSREQLLSEFGENVANLVDTQTEEPMDDWQNQKSHHLVLLRKASTSAQSIFLADAIASLRLMKVELAVSSDQMWTAYPEGRDMQSWYYRQLANALYDMRTNTPAALPFYTELINLTGEIFDRYERGDSEEERKAADIADHRYQVYSNSKCMLEIIVEDQELTIHMNLLPQPAVNGRPAKKAKDIYYYLNEYNTPLFFELLREENDFEGTTDALLKMAFGTSDGIARFMNFCDNNQIEHENFGM